MPPKTKTSHHADVKHLFVELASWQTADAAGKLKPPTEFRIFKAGINESVKGIWKFSAASAERVMSKVREYANEYSIDYAHGMFALFAADPAESGKAAGWFRPEVRQGELWATAVSWTPRAASYLENREYRYISPAFETDDAGEVMNLRNVALTNVPAIHDLEPLVASRDGAGNPETEKEERTMKSLLVLLGLAESASEAEALAALQRLQAPTLELLSLTGKPAVPEALTVVKAWKVAADSVPTLHQELSQLKQKEVDTERDALLAEGKRTGRIPPAYEPVMKTWELSQVKEFLKVAVPVMPPAPREGGGGAGAAAPVTLSQGEIEVAKAMGIDPAAMAKAKQLRAGVVPVAPASGTSGA